MNEFSTPRPTTWLRLARLSLARMAHALNAKHTPWGGYFSQPFRLGGAQDVWRWVRSITWAKATMPWYEILRACAVVWVQEDARSYLHPEAPLTPEARLWLSVWASWWLIRPTVDGGCQMPPEVVREILPDLRLAAARVAQMVEEAERLAQGPLPVPAPTQGSTEIPPQAPTMDPSLSWPHSAPAAPPFPQAPA